MPRFDEVDWDDIPSWEGEDVFPGEEPPVAQRRAAQSGVAAGRNPDDVPPWELSLIHILLR